MNSLYQSALIKADEIRIEKNLNMFEPVNIFDLCTKLELAVRFVDIDMEGMYAVQDDGRNPTIIVSALRPLPRRCFTGAHELGHHVFKHGSRLDSMYDETDQTRKHPDEILVDYFAGALLMPLAGVMAEFAKRDWEPEQVSPFEYYTICSIFGTGYSTLVRHCKANSLISTQQEQLLLRSTPAKIFRKLFTDNAELSYFKIIDGNTQVTPIDVEVSNYLLLPKDIQIEGDHLVKYQETHAGIAYKAIMPGILRISSSKQAFASFVRIQNTGYIGLAENRHLETLID